MTFEEKLEKEDRERMQWLNEKIAEWGKTPHYKPRNPRGKCIDCDTELDIKTKGTQCRQCLCSTKDTLP